MLLVMQKTRQERGDGKDRCDAPVVSFMISLSCCKSGSRGVVDGWLTVDHPIGFNSLRRLVDQQIVCEEMNALSRKMLLNGSL